MTTYPDPQLNDSDLELLSAYIDQQLTAAERAALDRRLENEPALQLALDELRTTVTLLRDLPPAPPPRSFALDPRSVAPKRSWSFPWMQLGSALVAATLLLVFGFVLTRGIRGIGGGAQPASAPMAASAPTSAPAAAAATAAPAAAVPAAEPTAASAAEAPMAERVAPTEVAAAATAAPLAAAAAPTAAPEPTAAPAAADLPGVTAAPAAPETALQTVPQPTGAPPSIASGGAATGAQPSAEATPAAGAPANDTSGVPGTATQRQAAATPTPATYSAQIATSANAASDTQNLDQQAAPTPQASAGGGQSGTALVVGALLLVALGGAVIWLFSRRKS